MKKIKEFFWYMFDGKRSNIVLAVIVLVAAILLCRLINAHPEWLRYMYCTAKGW